MLYLVIVGLVIVGLVIAGFLFFWGLVELVRAERSEREAAGLREAARLALDAEAHKANLSFTWRD